MIKVFRLTERESAILERLVTDEIDVIQDAKRTARTRITTPSRSDDMNAAMSEYDYFTDQLHDLYRLKGKLSGDEEE